MRASTVRNGRRSSRSRQIRLLWRKRHHCASGSSGRAATGVRAGRTTTDDGASGSRRWRARRTASSAGQRDPQEASAYFAQAELDPPVPVMMLHRRSCALTGSEPICKVLPKPVDVPAMPRDRADPGRLAARAERTRHHGRDPARGRGKTSVYGVRKVWRQLAAKGSLWRAHGGRLMRRWAWLRPSGGGGSHHRSRSGGGLPLDRVNRQFRAECPTGYGWRILPTSPLAAGFVYAAFVIDRLRPPDRGLACVALGPGPTSWLDALEQAARAPALRGAASSVTRIAGSKYVSIRYTVALGPRRREPSSGSVGDSYETLSPRR